MKTIRKITTLILGPVILMTALMTSGCASRQSIAQATADVYSGITNTTLALQVFNKNKEISDAVYLNALNLADVVTTDLDQFKNTARALGTITVANKQQLISQLSEVVNMVGKIGAIGVGLKNPDSINKFNSAIAIAQIALQTIQTLLIQLKNPLVVNSAVVSLYNIIDNRRMKNLKSTVASLRQNLAVKMIAEGVN